MSWPGVIERFRLKDPDTALESASRPISVPPELDAILAKLRL